MCSRWCVCIPRYLVRLFFCLLRLLLEGQTSGNIFLFCVGAHGEQAPPAQAQQDFVDFLEGILGPLAIDIEGSTSEKEPKLCEIASQQFWFDFDPKVIQEDSFFNNVAWDWTFAMARQNGRIIHVVKVTDALSYLRRHRLWRK